MPGILWGVLIYILVMLFDSISLLTLMVYYALFSNMASSTTSFGNDPLYCCKFYGVVSTCPASYGPCASTPTLAVNPDVYVFMIFASVFVVLEIMAFFFVHRMYQYYTRLQEKYHSEPVSPIMKKASQIGPSLLPERLQVPFLTSTVPRLWSEFQKRIESLVSMDDTQMAMTEQLIKKQN